MVNIVLSWDVDACVVCSHEWTSTPALSHATLNSVEHKDVTTGERERTSVV